MFEFAIFLLGTIIQDGGMRVCPDFTLCISPK